MSIHFCPKNFFEKNRPIRFLPGDTEEKKRLPRLDGFSPNRSHLTDSGEIGLDAASTEVFATFSISFSRLLLSAEFQ